MQTIVLQHYEIVAVPQLLLLVFEILLYVQMLGVALVFQQKRMLYVALQPFFVVVFVVYAGVAVVFVLASGVQMLALAVVPVVEIVEFVLEQLV
jgi:hypothetical protein